MAEKYAVANGNWSNPATWNGGTLPGNADDVYANGKTVTIDIDLVGSYSVLSIRTTAGGTAAAGGYFQVTASRTIEFVAGGSGIVAGTASCVQLNHATPDEVAIRWATGGSGVIVRGGSGAGARGILNKSTGSVTVTGNVTGGSGSDGCGITNISSGSVAVTGDVTGGSVSTAYGIQNPSTGSVTVTGNVTGASAYGILNASTGSVTVTGNVTGGSVSNAHGIVNNSSGIVTINGDCYAGNAPALYNAADGVIDVYGSLNPSPAYNTDVAINNNATSGKIIFSTLKADTTNHRWPGVIGRCFVRDTNSYLQIYDKDEQHVTYIDNSGVNNPPAESDVRYGVTYTTGGVRTGTCHVPAPDSVAYGVPVDNTVGTAALRMSDVANAVWNELRSAHTTPGTFGAVSEWAGGDSGGSDWTDDEKKQIRYRLGIDGTTESPSTNTPHLGNSYSTLDDLATHVSTRLAASDYEAPDNASISAIKTQTDKFSFAGTGPYDVKATLDGEKVTVLANEDKTGYSLATADVSAIADAVWDEATSGHQTAGTYGKTSEWTTTASGVWGHTTRTLTAFGFNVTVDMSQTLPTSPGPGTVGEALKRADTLRFTGAAGEELVLASATVDVDEQAIADAIVAEIQDQNLVQVVVQPLVANVQRTDGDGGVITLWQHARIRASWHLNANLESHDLRLIIFSPDNPSMQVCECSGNEVSVTLQSDGSSVVAVNAADTKMPSPGIYSYILRDQTTDAVLIAGRCIVKGAPDASS